MPGGETHILTDDGVESVPDIVDFVNKTNVPDHTHEYGPKYKDVPIVIDNGQHTFKAGFACDEEPILVFRNRVSKSKYNKNRASDILVGNEIADPESAKGTYRSLFDSGFVTNFNTMSEVLDYTFSKLGIKAESGVAHPILMTEAMCNFSYCREKMNELLFEVYNVPSVTYCVSGLLSSHHHQVQMKNKKNVPKYGLVISLGYTNTYIMPIVGGEMDTRNCKRLAIGGEHLHNHVTTLLHLKYPLHKPLLTPAYCLQVLDFVYISQKYQNELVSKWNDVGYNEKYAVIFQLPYVEPVVKEISEEDRAKRKMETVTRLKAYMKAKREKQVVEMSQKIEILRDVQTWPANLRRPKMKEINIQTDDELEEKIQELAKKIQTTQNRLQGIAEPEPVDSLTIPIKVNYDIDEELLQTSDSELTDAQKKEKKKQRFIKNAAGGRERARKVRLQMRIEQEAMEKALEKRRLENPDQYVNEIKLRKQKLVRKRQLRLRRKEELNDRKSHASKQRMRLLVAQSQDDGDIKGKKAKARARKYEDNFGMDDSSWDVYRDISKESDSESERENEELEKVESLLVKYDKNYRPDDEEPDVKTYHQVVIGTERLRIPEIFFQPSLLGSDKAGIVECITWILRNFDQETQSKLVENVHLCGGPSSIKGMRERIEYELRTIRPENAVIGVNTSDSPITGAYKGACDWIKLDRKQFDSCSVSKKEYQEHGKSYFKESPFSNRLYK